MRLATLLIVGFMWLTIPTVSAEQESGGVSQVRREIETIQRDVAEVRRDQLNYKIEKDLLKETYSSNIQTINIMITIVLGMFSVVGFLGIRSISGLKKEYSEELANLNRLKERFAVQMETILKEQEEARKKYTEVTHTNEQQEKRLALLELQEKAATFYQNANYDRALEYIAIGLSLHSDDPILLQMKFMSMLKLNRFPQAVDVGEKLIQLEPRNTSTATNLCEAYLATNRIEKYEELIGKFRDELKADSKHGLVAYFETLKHFMKTDVSGMKQAIATCLETAIPGKTERIPKWTFTEIQSALNAKNPSKEYDLMVEFLQFLTGSKDAEELRAAIAKF